MHPPNTPLGETAPYCVNDRWLSAVVVRRDRAPRPHTVVAANGMHTRRNCKHLRKRPVRLARPEMDEKFSSLDTPMDKNPFDISLPLICDNNNHVRDTSAQQSSLEIGGL